MTTATRQRWGLAALVVVFIGMLLLAACSPTALTGPEPTPNDGSAPEETVLPVPQTIPPGDPVTPLAPPDCWWGCGPNQYCTYIDPEDPSQGSTCEDYPGGGYDRRAPKGTAWIPHEGKFCTEAGGCILKDDLQFEW